jgi:hypothetical protein
MKIRDKYETLTDEKPMRYKGKVLLYESKRRKVLSSYEEKIIGVETQVHMAIKPKSGESK